VVETVRLDASLRRRLRATGPEVIVPGRTLEAAAREVVDRGLSDVREYARVFGQAPG